MNPGNTAPAEVIRDEALVPAYQLPQRLTGETVSDLRAAREELLDTFARNVYGTTPWSGPQGGLAVETVRRGKTPHLPGASRLQLGVRVGPPEANCLLQVLVYLPADNIRCCFLGLNFSGNHTVDPDPEILLPQGWMHPWQGTGVENFRATEAGRGTRAHRWPVGMMLEAGCAFATLYCGDLAPDQDGHPQTAVFKKLFTAESDPGAGWGNIGIWAWGLSRVREHLAGLPELAEVPVVVAGHSRLGKAALWAAAQDEGFAGALSNCSGCLGAALSRRRFGETVARITQGYPHWFCPRLRQWAEREGEMPVDQHQLLALIAPRLLMVASADADDWADPRGEFLALRAASDLYRRMDAGGLEAQPFPEPDQFLRAGQVAYFLRRGGHDLLPATWDRAISFFPAALQP